MRIYLITIVIILNSFLRLFSQDFVEVINPEVTFYCSIYNNLFIGKQEIDIGMIDEEEISIIQNLVYSSNLINLLNNNNILINFGETSDKNISLGVKIKLNKENLVIHSPFSGIVTETGYDNLTLKRYVSITDFNSNKVTYGNILGLNVYVGQRVEKEQEIGWIDENKPETYLLIRRNGIFWNPININIQSKNIGIYINNNLNKILLHNTIEKVFLFNTYRIGDTNKCDYYLNLIKNQNIIWPIHQNTRKIENGFYESLFESSEKNLGIDLSANQESIVIAVNAGFVLSKTFDISGYGNYVIIRDNYGIDYIYGHLSSILVSQGDIIEKGQKIGLSGSSGLTVNNALHFGIRIDNVYINPTSVGIR